MEHDTIMLMALAMVGVPAIFGSSVVKNRTGSAALGFLSGIVFGLLGLGLAILSFGIKS